MDDIKTLAYARYQMHWLAEHGISLGQVNDLAAGWLNARAADPDYKGSLTDHLETFGFGHAGIWACFGAFLLDEYQDRERMRAILTQEQFNAYLDDIGDGHIQFIEAKNLIEECIKQEILQASGDMVSICRTTGWYMEPEDFVAKELMYDKEGRDVLLKALQQRTEEEAVMEFTGEYAFLSNFFPCEIVYGGITYHNAEAAFQAQKSRDETVRREFSDLKPDVAKRRGRRVHLRPDWETVKVDIMKDILYAKFTQNKGLMEKLLQTKNRLLVEGNYWHDNTWGKCSCAKCREKAKMNLLGKSLMSLRSSLEVVRKN